MDHERQRPEEPEAPDDATGPQEPLRTEHDPALTPESQEQAAADLEAPAWPEQDRPLDSDDRHVPEGDERAAPAPDWPDEARAAPEAGWAGQAARSDADDPHPPPSEVEAYSSAAAAAGDPAGAASGGAHTVPATDVGESTQCPRCGTENRPGLSFCRSCGQRLLAVGVASTVERPAPSDGSHACPRCGTHNRAGVAFCQNCGANLRGAAVAAGYVPPAVEGRGAAEETPERAILGPVVLLIAAIGLVAGWLLPFAYGTDALFERTLGPGGFGIAFWEGYPDVGAALADQAYYGAAAPVPLLVVLLVGLAVAGFLRPRPGPVQIIGLALALAWSVALAVLFLVVEVGGGWGNDLVGLLRELTPGGIILFLASLIAVIGTLTRFGRG